MIVVDTNIIAYLYLPTDISGAVEQILTLDSQWAAPKLWRSEFRNVLISYVKKQIIDLETAANIQNQAELLIGELEYEIDSVSVLSLAHQSGCTAYDCEFVSLAMGLTLPLVTTDKKILRIFPEIAQSPPQYLAAR